MDLKIDGELIFEHSDLIYDEHFKGFAVVPGSLIVATLINLVEQEFKIKVKEVEKFRFVNFTIPGRVSYILKKTENRVNCYLYQNEVITSRGQVILFSLPNR